MLLAERYQLLSRLGSGGHGEVWRAQDTLLARVVAVKTVRAALADSPEFVSRFRAEARSMATIEHRGVVGVFDFGIAEMPGGRTPYLVMQYLDGEPLHLLLARRGRVAPAAAMDLVAQAADALQAAHEAGVVHRDVKPGNLMIRPDGTVVLTDFGIARTAEGNKLTASGIVLGTATYCAPEQAEGAAPTPAMDVYALGVVAYECLAGRTPFSGENAVAIALKHLNEPPPPLPADIPAEVARVVMRALAKNPADRWPSAATLATAARTLADHLDTPATVLTASGGSTPSAPGTGSPNSGAISEHPGVGEHPDSGGKRDQATGRAWRRALLAGGGIAAAAIAAAVAWNLAQNDSRPEASAQARTGATPPAVSADPAPDLKTHSEDDTRPKTGTSPAPDASAAPDKSEEPKDRPTTGLIVGGIVYAGGPSPGKSSADGYQPGLVEVLDGKGRKVASKRSGEKGFRFSLPQGEYRIQTPVGDSACSTKAIVKLGRTTRADLKCTIPSPPPSEPSVQKAAIEDARGDAKGGQNGGEAPAYADLLATVVQGGKQGATAEFTTAGPVPTAAPSEGDGQSTWSVTIEQDGKTATAELVGAKGAWSLRWTGKDDQATAAKPVISGARISVTLGQPKAAAIDFTKPFQIVGAGSNVLHGWTDSAP